MRILASATTLVSGLLLISGCSDPAAGPGPSSGGSGGAGPDGSGGAPPTGGTSASGGTHAAGGVSATGGVAGVGGNPSSGGQVGIGGSPSTGGGFPSGGSGVGGSGTGGELATGGSGTGGQTATGGAGGDLPPLDCATAVNLPMPAGAEEKQNNGSDGQGNLAWEIWSNTGTGHLTIYPEPAFIASWDNDGGYLGRLGFEWGRWDDPDPVPYEQRGTLVAQFASRKSGSAGQYSYVGMYGWSVEPCVEWYVVDDSYNQMPINPGNTNLEGVVTIDGGEYNMYTRPTTGTGGSRCDASITNWMQFYSVRKTARACGQISLTEHFDAWKSLGMELGGLLEAKILVEVGGGTGSVELPIANVMELD